MIIQSSIRLNIFLKNIFVTFGILLSISLFAQSGSDLGRFLTEDWLHENYSYGYLMTSGTYDEVQGLFSDVTIEGTLPGIYSPYCKIHTKNNGRIDTVIIYYHGIPNENSIRQYAKSLVQYSNARIVKQESTGSRLYIEGVISTGYSGYKTIRINSSWSYNSFGTFFFGQFDVYYIMS